MPKQSTAILWLIHSLEVLALGAAVTCVVTLYQAFAGGHFDLATAGVTIASALGAFLLNGIKGILGNANFAQAIADLKAEAVQQQPVVIHNHIPAPAPAPTPTNATASVVQVPFPAPGTAAMPQAIRTTLNVPAVQS